MKVFMDIYLSFTNALKQVGECLILLLDGSKVILEV